jgi:hypothetical protein
LDKEKKPVSPALGAWSAGLLAGRRNSPRFIPRAPLIVCSIISQHLRERKLFLGILRFCAKQKTGCAPKEGLTFGAGRAIIKK